MLLRMNRLRTRWILLLESFVWNNSFRALRICLQLFHLLRHLLTSQIKQPMPETGKQESEYQEKDEKCAGLLRLRLIVYQNSCNGGSQQRTHQEASYERHPVCAGALGNLFFQFFGRIVGH